MKTSVATILLATAAFIGSSHAQTSITLGETRTLGYSDNGNANLLLADGPYRLSQTAVLNSIRFWVDNAAGNLELAMFDSGPNNDCKGGKLRAKTSSFNPIASSWNTAKPASPATLPPGNYCLAYLPSANNLSFRKGISSGINNTWFPLQFGSIPTTFAANPSGGDGFHWSLYATLTPGTPVPVISFNPPSPSIPANAPRGTVVAAIQVTMSDGSAFTGTLGFGTPYLDDNATFTISGSNLIVNPSGPGLSADASTTQNVTVLAQ
jgi:hypothetical protein